MRKGTVKKIVALGTGLTMLGATIFGASAAADLSQYPNPLFITNGAFVGNIVVGKAASTEDVLGAIELSAALQTAAVKPVQASGVANVYTVDKEAVQVKRTTRELTFFDSIRDVFDSAISESKLPTMLKDGTFHDSEGANKGDTDYTQTLDFSDENHKNVWFEFKTSDSGDEPADSYLWIDKKDVYTYSLTFDTAVEFDTTSSTTAAEDLQNNVIEIQGNKYTITSATVEGGDTVKKMELLAGETKVWMTQGEPLTRTLAGTEHTVVLTDVDEDGSRCGISVDGTTQWVDVGGVETINGVEIGVSDAIPVHSAGKDTDVCEVNVGATKILIEDGKEIKVNDKTLDNSKAKIFNDVSGEWGGFNLTYKPSDKVFLTAGTGPESKWVDPVLGNFEIDFSGISRNDETFTWKRSGSEDAKFVFQNIDDKTVEVNYHYDKSIDVQFAPGSDCDQPMLQEGDEVYYDYGSFNVGSLEGVQLYMVAPGDEVHLLEISNVDTDNNKISIKDVTYGKTYDDIAFTWGDNTNHAIQLTGTGTITLRDTGSYLIATDLGQAAHNQYTKYQHTVEFESEYNGPYTDLDLSCGDQEGNNPNDVNAEVIENTYKLFGNDMNTDGDNTAWWYFYADYNGANKRVEFDTPECNPGARAACTSEFEKSQADDKKSMMSDSIGTIAEWDNDESSGGTLMLPDDVVTAQVFITKVGAVVSNAGSGAVQFQQIQVGTAKLDSDISDVTAQNLIVVGGPCANSVASRLMGSPADCAAGFQEGEAMLKLFQQTNGNVALLVAGYNALDTRRAAKVLSNYKDYAASLKGMEVKVKGTTLSDVTVESVV